jgi:8-oxo-dGTP pyrophosphatase MutT (NUDIX family)
MTDTRTSFTGHADPALHQVKNPVVNVIILIDGKIPVLCRSKGGYVWYDLPGGKPEPEDATLGDTALRELLEEIGVVGEVASNNPVDIMPHPYLKDSHKIFMKCSYVSGEPRNCLVDEHEELLMLEPEEAVTTLRSRISPKVAQFLREIGREGCAAAATATPRKPFG